MGRRVGDLLTVSAIQDRLRTSADARAKASEDEGAEGGNVIATCPASRMRVIDWIEPTQRLVYVPIATR